MSLLGGNLNCGFVLLGIFILSYLHACGRYPSVKTPERFPIKIVGNDGEGDVFSITHVGTVRGGPSS